MANISLLLSLINGTAQTVDLSANTLVTSIVKVGGGSGTDLTQSILNRLISLQDGSDVDATYHTHDTRYYTQSQIGSSTSSSGSDLIGDDNTYTEFTPAAATVKGALSGIDSALGVINSSLSSITSDISTLQSDVLTLQSDVATLQGQVAGKADNNLGNLVSTAINADLNPDFLDDTNFRNIGNIVPFASINAQAFFGGMGAFTVTGDVTAGSPIISNITGTLPSYTGGIYTVFAPGYTGYNDSNEVVTSYESVVVSFDSPTQITMADNAILSGTGVTFYILPVTKLNSPDQTIKSALVFVGSGNSTNSSSGAVVIQAGNALATPSSLLLQGITYTSAASGPIANFYSVQNIIDATLVTQTVGPLVVNNVYIINNYVAGDDFTNVGGTNVTGAIFRATGTTPTNYSNGSTLQPVVIAGLGTRLLNRIPAGLTSDQLRAAVFATYLITHDFVSTLTTSAVTQTAVIDYLSGATGVGDVSLGNSNNGFLKFGQPYNIFDSSDANNSILLVGAPKRGSSPSANLFIYTGVSGGSGGTGGLNLRSGDNDGSGGSGLVTVRSGIVRGSNPSGGLNLSTGSAQILSTAATGALNASSGSISNLLSTATTGQATLISGASATNSSGGTGQAVVRAGDLTGTGSGVTGQAVLRAGDKTNASSTGSTGNVTGRSGNHSGTGNSGTALFASGDVNNGTSGSATYRSGNSTGTTGTGTGSFSAVSGNVTNAAASGATGSATYGSGSNSGTGGSGNVNLNSGSAVTGSTGQVNGLSGNITGTGSTTSTGDVAFRSGHIAGASASGGTGQATFRSGDVQAASISGTAGTGQATFRSGDILGTTSGNTGPVTYRSGNTAGTGNTGTFTGKSGDITSASSSAITGFVYINSGDVTNASASATSGEVVFRSGDVAGSGFSAQALIRSGNTNTGNSGPVNIYSGNVAAGTADSGDINAITGSSFGGNRGSINLTGKYIQLTTDVGGNIHMFLTSSGSMAIFENGTLKSALNVGDQNVFGVNIHSSFIASSQNDKNSIAVLGGSDAGGATKGGDVVIGAGFGSVASQDGGSVFINSGGSAAGYGGDVNLVANGAGSNRGKIINSSRGFEVQSDWYASINATDNIILNHGPSQSIFVINGGTIGTGDIGMSLQSASGSTYGHNYDAIIQSIAHNDKIHLAMQAAGDTATSGVAGDLTLAAGSATNGTNNGGNVYIHAGASSGGTAGNVQISSDSSIIFNTPSIVPLSDLVTDLGSYTNRFANIIGSFISATDSIGLRDTSGNPLMTISSGGPFFGLYTGPFIASPTTLASTDSFGFRGRDIATGGTHNLVMWTGRATTSGNTGKLRGMTGNATSGDSGNIEFATGSASGTRGKFLIDASSVDVNNTNIINVLDPTSLQHAATKNYVDAFGGTVFQTNSGGTTSLTVTSARDIVAIGSSSETKVLPSTSLLQVGNWWRITNRSTASIIIQNASLATIATIAPQRIAHIRVTSTGAESFAVYLQPLYSNLDGSLDLQTSKVTNVGDPTSAQDAATKNYVDVNKYTSRIETGTYLAVKYDEIFADSSGGAFTITLPAAPVLGDRVKFIDYANTWATNNVTVDRNGLLIDGAAADFTLNVDGAWAEFIYTGATRGWKVLT